MSKNLSTRKIAALRPREKRYTVTDGHGLTLRVHPTGVKSWCLRISYGGVVSDLSLGRWPEVSLMPARQQARRKRKELGQEPPRSYVLQDAFRLWCNLKRGRITSYMDEKRRLERYVISPLGRRQLDEITAPLVIATVRHIEAEGHQATLKRVLMRTREIMDLAVCAGYIQHNPIDRVSRVFAAPIVKPMPAPPWRELPLVMETMKDAPARMRVLFLFSLCSMLRPGENAKLRKSWIEADVLTIPAVEMKKGRAHRVPITAFMQTLINAEQRLSPHPRSDFIFAAKQTGKHVSAQALAKHLHSTDLSGKLVAHGLRSIARSWLADHETPFEVAEACLSHVSGTAVSRAYQRSDYLAARTPVMTRWSAFIEDCARKACLVDEILDPAKH
ncbi:tyrosine-type recombinase/integrase [Sutterella wadsworthensis]|uniref:tyrosine-type recombinase/integrase n=1 Tax=Sutterella wadsworthensis TaxID=40545 RepID=UPI003F5AF084